MFLQGDDELSAAAADLLADLVKRLVFIGAGIYPGVGAVGFRVKADSNAIPETNRQRK